MGWLSNLLTYGVGGSLAHGIGALTSEWAKDYFGGDRKLKELGLAGALSALTGASPEDVTSAAPGVERAYGITLPRVTTTRTTGPASATAEGGGPLTIPGGMDIKNIAPTLKPVASLPTAEETRVLAPTPSVDLATGAVLGGRRPDIMTPQAGFQMKYPQLEQGRALADIRGKMAQTAADNAASLAGYRITMGKAAAERAGAATTRATTGQTVANIAQQRADAYSNYVNNTVTNRTSALGVEQTKAASQALQGITQALQGITLASTLPEARRAPIIAQHQESIKKYQEALSKLGIPVLHPTDYHNISTAVRAPNANVQLIVENAKRLGTYEAAKAAGLLP